MQKPIRDCTTGKLTGHMECRKIGQPLPRDGPIQRIVNDHDRTFRWEDHVHVNSSQHHIGNHTGLGVGRLRLFRADDEMRRISHLPQRVDDLIQQRL